MGWCGLHRRFVRIAGWLPATCWILAGWLCVIRVWARKAVLSHHVEVEAELERAGARLLFRPFAETGERMAQRTLEPEITAL
jgi:hypothetical protein